MLLSLAVAALALAGCESSGSARSFTPAEVRRAFHDHGIAVRRPTLPFPQPNGVDVLSPELDGSFAPYQIWIMRSAHEAEQYKEFYESDKYGVTVTPDNPEYAVDRTALNRNVLLVVFRGSHAGDDAAAILSGLG